MTIKYSVKYAVGPNEVKQMDTTQLRNEFLVSNIFKGDEITLTYTHYDRFIVGGAKPVKKILKLEAIEPLKAKNFLDRREIGIINVGGKGVVTADGQKYELDYKEALYIGAGTKDVAFQSDNKKKPALFYLNSAPAQTSYPVQKITKNEAEVIELGEPKTSNHRILNKLIVNGIVETCQLQMGMTELQTGSVWNTIPSHVHDRRMEAYFYFEMPQGQALSHFMGEPQETRHIWVQNNEAVVSPPWGIHSGAGTSNYTFIWGMGGENLDYGDMDTCTPDQLR